MKITRVGVDIAKSVFHVYAVDRHEQPQWQTKLKRGDWLDALCAQLSANAEVGMEACASAHHWCVFRLKTSTDSGAKRAPIPIQFEH